MTWISVQERTLYYNQIEGEPPTTVFIHGWANNHTVWDEVVNRLPYHCIVYDIQGHGRSGHDADSLSFQSLTKDILAILEKVPHDDICVVGHSLGGMIAMHLLKHLVPDHLVLIDSSATNIRDSSRWLDEPLEYYTRWKNDYEFTDLSTCDDNTDAFRKGLRDTNPTVARECLALMRRNKKDIAASINDVTPLLMRGSKDSILPVSHHESLKHTFKEYEEAYLPTGHNPHVERPVRTAELIKNYLQG